MKKPVVSDIDGTLLDSTEIDVVIMSKPLKTVPGFSDTWMSRKSRVDFYFLFN